MTNKRKNVLYIGVTRNLQHRVLEHKQAKVAGFTRRYKVKQLVYYEEFEMAIDAFDREKQLKNWHREWKYNLMKRLNPMLEDLSAEWY